MSVIRVCRLEESPTEILSAVLVDGKLIGFGLELPYRNNQSAISSIPVGTYSYSKFFSPRLRQEVILLQNVPGRTGIEIHIGNTHLDISGCILVGKSVGYINDVRAVLNSTAAMKHLLEITEYKGSVYIFNAYGAT